MWLLLELITAAAEWLLQPPKPATTLPNSAPITTKQDMIWPYIFNSLYISTGGRDPLSVVSRGSGSGFSGGVGHGGGAR